jgi:Protein of unknown function (DUF3040)
MTYVARQQRALSEIECMLRRTDPCLASKFGMFSRLAVDEEMPSAEQVLSGRASRRSRTTRVGQLPYRLGVLLWMAAAAAAIMVGLLAGAGGHVRCVPVKAAQIYSLQSSQSIHCNREVRQHARRTRPGRLRAG